MRWAPVLLYPRAGFPAPLLCLRKNPVGLKRTVRRVAGEAEELKAVPADLGGQLGSRMHDRLRRTPLTTHSSMGDPLATNQMSGRPRPGRVVGAWHVTLGRSDRVVIEQPSDVGMWPPLCG